MVAKISSNNSLFSTLLYNKNKIDKVEATLLSTKNVYERADGFFSMQTTMKSFEPYLVANKKTEKPIFHVSLNPSPKDRLTDEEYKNIADKYMTEMGYENQPYVVFKHMDIDRVHLHIVSVRVDETGKKLDSNFENMRSMGICRQIERDFSLHPATKQEHQQSYTLSRQPLNYKEGNVKQQINNITKAILNNYSFQSLGEYRTLLEIFNVTVEEIKGLINGKPYHGLIYSALTENSATLKKEKIGTPLKSSLFGKSINLQTLEKHFLKSKDSIEKENIKKRLKTTISKVVGNSKNLDELKTLLLANNISPIFRVNEQGRLYGVSFIDYQDRVILNGSRLGKEFSANALHERFSHKSTFDKSQNVNRSQYELNKSTETANESNTLNLELFSFEQHGEDLENEKFLRKKQEEKKRRLRRGQRW